MEIGPWNPEKNPILPQVSPGDHMLLVHMTFLQDAIKE